MGKLMRICGLSQFWSAKFKNHWYTGIGWSFQLHFYDLRYHSDESKQHAILKQTAGKILVNKDALYYFVLLREWYATLFS